MKRQGKQQPRRCHGHQKPYYATADGEQDAFRERLPNDLPGCCAHRQSHCSLRTTRYPASQQQVRHIGTGDQQYQTAHGEQDLQAAAVFLFHHGHACSGGYHLDNLLGKHADDIRHEVGRIPGIVLQPLA